LTFVSQSVKYVGMNREEMRRVPARRIRLKKAAVIQPGYFCRGRVRTVPDGTHRLLQARDLRSESGIRPESLVKFIPERDPHLYSVTRDDVLLTAKGQRHRAHLIRQDLRNVLASSVFYILRADREILRPGYLAWWLGLPEARAKLAMRSRGTGIKYIEKSSLGDMALEVPPLEIQERIEKVVGLREREASIRTSIETMKDELVRATCLGAVKGR